MGPGGGELLLGLGRSGLELARLHARALQGRLELDGGRRRLLGASIGLGARGVSVGQRLGMLGALLLELGDRRLVALAQLGRRALERGNLVGELPGPGLDALAGGLRLRPLALGFLGPGHRRLGLGGGPLGRLLGRLLGGLLYRQLALARGLLGPGHRRLGLGRRLLCRQFSPARVLFVLGLDLLDLRAPALGARAQLGELAGGGALLGGGLLGPGQQARALVFELGRPAIRLLARLGLALDVRRRVGQLRPGAL